MEQKQEVISSIRDNVHRTEVIKANITGSNTLDLIINYTQT
ncbi:hypothetical protein BY447_4366 [Pantoea sp. JKS000250]|jgi:hypothetical protein|nr:hypothetical protein BY447_4366 [Pantoea sp. JKS000250]